MKPKKINEILAGFRDQKFRKRSDRQLEGYSKSAYGMKKHYEGYKWILRSPGNDLLTFYDRQNELLGKENRAYSKIPPSIVYHYRFEHKYPEELFDKSKNYGVFAYLRDQLRNLHNTSDHTYWSQVKNKRYDWLVNKPHEHYVFDFEKELFDFMKNEFNQKAIRNSLGIHTNTNKLKKFNREHMFWRGKLKGWSIIVVEDKFGNLDAP